MSVETTKVEPKIEQSWLLLLAQEFKSGYFLELKKFIIEERAKHTIYPRPSEIFNAFNRCPVGDTKVVIIGQDPYHGPGQAHGLSFSVSRGMPQPPSLKNIFKELHDDLGISIPEHGCLESWAEQGVLLLNAVLTVRKGEPASHRNKGWERFTDAAIHHLSAQRGNLVFMLWGNFARNKKALIDTDKHLILEAAHPSPYSAYNGFFGCRHFSKANAYLQKNGFDPIDWNPV